ncbi:MAG: hypothetical protein LLG09_04555 [Negativicutes bacterium]|nr:hypothetical protein [Negativicutes bacterium]
MTEKNQPCRYHKSDLLLWHYCYRAFKKALIPTADKEGYAYLSPGITGDCLFSKDFSKCKYYEPVDPATEQQKE